MKPKLLTQVYQVLCDLTRHLLRAPWPTICMTPSCLFSVPKTFHVNLYLRFALLERLFLLVFSWVVQFCHLDVILNVISSELLSSTTPSKEAN